MNILQVIVYLNPAKGGDINVCYNLSKELLIKGHSITILTTEIDFDQDFSDKLEKMGVKIVKCPVFLNLSQFFYSPKIKIWLRNNLPNYDIIHLHNYRSYQSNIIRKYSNKLKIPYIVHPHGTIPTNIEKNPLKSFLRTFFDRFYGYKILEDSCKIIANSRAEMQNLKNIFDKFDKLILVYNGIEQDFQLPPKGKFIDKFNLKNKYLLFLGRIDKTKGLKFILDVFEMVSVELDYPLSLVIVGPYGNFSKDLNKIIKEKNLKDIKIIDFLYGSDKLSAYQDAEVFLCPPNYNSGVLLTPLESILCNTPVIITEEIKELFEKKDIAYIVKYGDVSDFKNKIIKLLNNPEISNKMLINGRKFIQKDLNWSSVTNRIEQIYKECINPDI